MSMLLSRTLHVLSLCKCCNDGSVLCALCYASWTNCRPPSSFVNQHVWSVCCWPHSQTVDLTRPFCIELPDMSLNLSVSNSAETVYDEFG